MKLRPHQQRTVDAMAIYSHGQSYQPTGSGKTICMIADTLRVFEGVARQTVVVVAPRIGLALQLCSEFLEHITNVAVMHVHSGETHHFSTTKPSEIQMWDHMVRTAFNPDAPKHKLIFTTYNSQIGRAHV